MAKIPTPLSSETADGEAHNKVVKDQPQPNSGETPLVELGVLLLHQPQPRLIHLRSQHLGVLCRGPDLPHCPSLTVIF